MRKGIQARDIENFMDLLVRLNTKLSAMPRNSTAEAVFSRTLQIKCPDAEQSTTVVDNKQSELSLLDIHLRKHACMVRHLQGTCRR